MIKKLLPFEKLVYQSTLSKEELINHLQNEIEAEKSFGFGVQKSSYSKPYIGKTNSNRFEIKRVVNYRNSFLPVIKGQIKDGINGAKINVKMGLVDFVKVFMILWLGAVSLGCAGAIYSLFFTDTANSEAGFFMFIPFAMLLFGLAMVYFGFKTESKKSIKDLEGILHAKVIEE
ncbi:hypothetical protein SAMN05444397_10147 [Flavobacterium aquidurense]|uniref:Holin-X, holin superfamily III n=1 Tax=Flavobacterium frigidimaris TaxID=262320 RepID=A0ABX4BLN0_FLAFR|nr:hypothetical protein [Flavobacterium frigidimaris]OXA76324.1 hypothetical protein B0A65_19285 [Flavobacterium frigidimaris]SDY20980.1 hypothetical protein SAMN05444397_10147 [Flavobacterium aquidurense]